MRLQWDHMTDFARRMLRRLGAVPLRDLERCQRLRWELEQAYEALLHDLDRMAEGTAATHLRGFKMDLTQVQQDVMSDNLRLSLRTETHNYVVPRHNLQMFRGETYAVQQAVRKAFRLRLCNQADQIVDRLTEASLGRV